MTRPVLHLPTLETWFAAAAGDAAAFDTVAEALAGHRERRIPRGRFALPSRRPKPFGGDQMKARSTQKNVRPLKLAAQLAEINALSVALARLPFELESSQWWKRTEPTVT